MFKKPKIQYIDVNLSWILSGKNHTGHIDGACMVNNAAYKSGDIRAAAANCQLLLLNGT